jgi:predicted transposase YdaD
MVYKFPELSREVIEAMFTVRELKQTRVYRDAMDEGRIEGRTEEAQALVMRQLARRVGELSPEQRSLIQSLSLVQLESLSEALLDFSSLSDLDAWLQSQSSTTEEAPS